MKILCIHATAGAGHQKAAEAVEAYVRQHTSHQVVIVDALDYTSAAFKKSYKEGYGFLISKIPTIWGIVFAVTDWAWIQPLGRFIRGIYNHLNAGKLEKFLMQERFDVIVSCHFMSTEVASRLKQTGKISSKLVTVITDFDVHHLWLGRCVDHYAVASDWTQARLESYGVPSEKITVTGIPTHEKFSQPMDKHALRVRFGLEPDGFAVLVATGSFGIGPIKEILNAIDGYCAMVVCGHNKHLYQELTQNPRAHIKVFGLVDNMHELMAAADAMVTKPGGLSTSEALVRDLPMVFFSAIPGQEQGNVNVLAHYGVGIKPASIEGITDVLKTWMQKPDFYRQVKENMLKVARPRAAADVVKLIENSW